jgi:two-component system NarL family sensor kinase
MVSTMKGKAFRLPNWCHPMRFGAARPGALHAIDLRWALLALAVVLAAVLAQTTAVRHQAARATEQQRKLVQDASQASYERELRQLVAVARTVIGRLADQPGDTAVLQRQALSVLAQLDLGQNGYFFVYDAQGRLLLDPAQMRLQGVDFCDPADTQGAGQARQLLATARQGGGLVQYDWQMPSSGQHARKISYVSPAGRWGWTIGTGIYENDIAAAIRKIDEEASQGLKKIFEFTLVIGMATIFIMGIFAYGLHRHAFSRVNQTILRLRGQVVNAEDQTRHQMARELHDGVLQVMTSAKYLLESAQTRTASAGRRTGEVQALVERALAQLGMALTDVRLIAHGAQAAGLRQGLAAALARLLDDARALGVQTALRVDGPAESLPGAMQSDLYRMAHSGGQAIALALHVDAQSVTLRVSDDGHGFLPGRDAQAHPPEPRGMGLRNMRARVALHHGRCQWHSTPQGTTVDIVLPLDRHA